MSKLTLMSIPVSNFGRAVQMLLEEKGVDYDFVVAKPQSDEVKAVHPFGKVPVLKHGDLALCESEAMARYIDAAFEGPKFFPDDLKARALVDEWVSLHNAIIDPLLIRKYALGYVIPKMMGTAPDVEALQALVPDMEKQFAIIEDAVSDGYLVGNAPTYADFNLFTTLYYMPGFPESKRLLAKFPAMQAYIERIGTRESAQKTAPPM